MPDTPALSAREQALYLRKPLHNAWLRRDDPTLPEAYYWRTLRFPNYRFHIGPVEGLVIKSYVARAVRPPGLLARSTDFDCPLWMRVLITEGKWTGNQIICFVTTDLAPHVNPTPSDIVGQKVRLEGSGERDRGFWFTAYLREPYTVERVDPYVQDW